MDLDLHPHLIEHAIELAAERALRKVRGQRMDRNTWGAFKILVEKHLAELLGVWQADARELVRFPDFEEVSAAVPMVSMAEGARIQVAEPVHAHLVDSFVRRHGVPEKPTPEESFAERMRKRRAAT